MPFSLFEYHTMGLSPMPGYDRPKQSVQRFSFNFPSGKKWTLSPADDARAREFYCGGGGGTESLPMQDAKMIVYSIGIRQDGNGEQIYKTCALRSRLRPLPSGGYMMSHGDYEDIVADSPKEIIRVVNAERPASNQLPYNLPITDLTYGECGGGGTGNHDGMVQCPDGSWDIPNGIIEPCYGRGGSGGTGPVVEPVTPLVDGIGCPTNLRKDTDGNFIAYRLAKDVGSFIAKRTLPTFCNKDTRQYVPNNLPELEFEGAWMQSAISGKDDDGYVWSGQSNQLLRKKCPATFKKLYDIANEEYKRALGSGNCSFTVPMQNYR